MNHVLSDVELSALRVTCFSDDLQVANSLMNLLNEDCIVATQHRKVGYTPTSGLTVKDQLVYMCLSAIFSLASSGLAITLKVDEDGKTTSIMQKFSSDEHESYTYTRRALDH